MRVPWSRRTCCLFPLVFVAACGSDDTSSAGADAATSTEDGSVGRDAQVFDGAARGDAAGRDGGVDGGAGKDTGNEVDASTPGDAAQEDAGDNGSDGGQPDGRAPQDSGSPSMGLHVVGNTLVDNGKTVRLFGVDRSGTEYTCIQGNGFFDGAVDQAAISAMLSWHINSVRVPLNEDCWLAINGSPSQYSGAAYQSAISQYVSLLRQNGLYVILDLHWNAGGANVSNGQQSMADADHAPAFWTSVATAFKADQGVIFDLYNEPHDIPWACWLNGGCQTNGWNVAGMQSLLNAVRGANANNVVMAGGLAYASDLSSWLANKPSDPKGNLAASYHGYNFAGCNTSSCWTAQLQPVAAQVPLITGELGENDCAHAYIDGYMSWADTRGVSYLGWAWNADFNCSSGPGLISDYNGTATAFGVGLQSHFAAVNP